MSFLFTSSLFAQYSVFWNDISGLSYDVDKDLLSYSKEEFDYGNAFSINEVAADGEEKVFFRMNSEDVDIMIGYVDTKGGDYQHDKYQDNFDEIEYSFHFLEGEVSIVKQGSTIPDFGPETFSTDDEFEIHYAQGSFEFWFKGDKVFGDDFEVEESLRLEVLMRDYDGQTFGPASSDKATPISLSYTTTEQDHNGGGSITASVLGGKRPYRYIWNDAPFISKSDYDRYAPSLHSELSKEENAHIAAQFDLSKVPTYDEFVALRANPSVSNLMSKEYNLKIMDAEGESISEDISVNAKVNWPSSTDYSWANNQLTKTSRHTNLLTAPVMTSDNILYPSKDGNFGFKVSTIGEKAVGIRDGDVSVSDYRNINFGFYIDGQDVYLLRDGVVDADLSASITSNDHIAISRTGSAYSAKVNGVEIATHLDASPEKLKRWDVYIGETNEIFRTDKVYCWWYIPLYALQEEEGVCGLKSSDLLSDNEGIITRDYPYGVSFEWRDHLGSTNYPNAPTLSNVDPGWYTLIANVAHPTAPYSMWIGTYYIGYKVNWFQEVALVNQPTTNSLELGISGPPGTSSVLGESNSTNIFNKPVDNDFGWIYTELPGLATGKPYMMELSPWGNYAHTWNYDLINTSLFYGGFSVTKYGVKSMPMGNTPIEYGLSITQNVNYMVYTPNTQQEYLISLHPGMLPTSYNGPDHFVADEGDKIVQLIDGSDYKLYINGILKTTVNIPSLSAATLMNIKGEISADFGTLIVFNNGESTYIYHDQILNCLTSFACRDQSYNLLAPELRAEHYNTINGNLYFQYQGEYNYGTLDYVIRDLDGNDVTPNVSISASDKDYGDNRYVLNMNNLSDGYYTLQVTNEKKENYHLRIYKEY
jgi:hypothetical protein